MEVDAVNALIDTVNGWLCGYILVALLVAGGIYFTVRLQFLPTALLKEALRTLAARGGRSSGAMSSFQALMVSTASRVGRKSPCNGADAQERVPPGVRSCHHPKGEPPECDSMQ